MSYSTNIAGCKVNGDGQERESWPLPGGVEHLSELIFCSGPIPALLLVTCTMANLNIAGAGVIAFLALYAFVKLAKISHDKLSGGHLIYNPILVGMSIGAIFELSASVILLIGISTVVTFFITIGLSRLFLHHALPVLSLPFAIVSTTFYLASTGYTKLFSLALYDNRAFVFIEAYIPELPATMLKAFGCIIFMPNVVAGAVILTIIIVHSRLLALHAIISYAAGIFIHSLLITSFEQALHNPYSFNYILVGLALGGTFLLPTLRSTIVCLLGVGISVLLVDVTGGVAQMFRIPVFTLPFNFTVIIVLFALKSIAYTDYNYDIRKTPELSLYSAILNRERFHINEVTIGLPFAVPCSVYQGCNGRWTHKDQWKNAYDFIITDKSGNMCSGGSSLDDYYVYGQDVVSPVSGYISSCCNTLPDNQIGRVDHINNWGNYIIIHSLDGWFVEISHLMPGTQVFKPGDYVELGQVIGRCGNSGYSPLPHLHIQVQRSGLLGDWTVPFNFAIYQSGSQVLINAKPLEKDCIKPINYSSELSRYMQFYLGASYRYKVMKDGEYLRDTTFTVKRSADCSGRLFFEDESGSQLYFTVSNGSFFFYDFVGSRKSYLNQLYLAMPRLPLVNETYFTWTDTVSPLAAYKWLTLVLLTLSSWVNSTRQCPRGEWSYKYGEILGSIQSVHNTIKTNVIVDAYGFKEISCNNIKLIKEV